MPKPIEETTTGNAVLGDISIEKITQIFEKIFMTLKKILAWLGILILPNEDEKDNYPTK